MNPIQKLLSIASGAFTQTRSDSARLACSKTGMSSELQAMLDLKNGFVAFESALIVFPTVDVDFVPSIDSWNRPDGWRRWYRGYVSDEIIFFAQDLFAGQFGVSSQEVVRLDPESGEIRHYAESVLQWADSLLVNYAEDTGWPLAHDWQLANGPISPTHRLLPKQPFILGGDYVIENLTPVENMKAMQNWGRLFQAVRSVPDGQEFTISGWLQ